ncbi:hypothetical protein EBZ02_07125 [bacterium]|nr:hypothetical protein [bacterium]
MERWFLILLELQQELRVFKVFKAYRVYKVYKDVKVYRVYRVYKAYRVYRVYKAYRVIVLLGEAHMLLVLHIMLTILYSIMVIVTSTRI